MTEVDQLPYPHLAQRLTLERQLDSETVPPFDNPVVHPEAEELEGVGWHPPAVFVTHYRPGQALFTGKQRITWLPDDVRRSLEKREYPFARAKRQTGLALAGQEPQLSGSGGCLQCDRATGVSGGNALRPTDSCRDESHDQEEPGSPARSAIRSPLTGAVASATGFVWAVRYTLVTQMVYHLNHAMLDRATDRTFDRAHEGRKR